MLVGMCVILAFQNELKQSSVSPSCRVSSAGPFASSCSTINVNDAVRSKRRTETSANTVAFRSACLWACPTTVSVTNKTQFWCSFNCFHLISTFAEATRLVISFFFFWQTLRSFGNLITVQIHFSQFMGTHQSKSRYIDHCELLRFMTMCTYFKYGHFY